MRRPPLWLASFTLGAITGSVLTFLVADEPADDVAVGPPSTSTTLTSRSTETSTPSTTVMRTTTTTAPEIGTRRQPLPLGEEAVRQDSDGSPLWVIQVLSYRSDATAEVMAENPAQDPPGNGQQYAIVRIMATYEGAAEPARLGESVNFEAVDDGNVSYDFQDTCLIYPDPLDLYNAVYTGGTIEGNLCWEVASDTAGSLLLAVTTGLGSTGIPYFMALR